MKISSNMLEKLKKWEGVSLKPYKDGFINGVQQYSIGYGHQIKPNEQNLHSGITLAKAELLLKNDLILFENGVNKASGLSQNQFDALVSFAFNCGLGALNRVVQTWNSTKNSILTVNHLKLYKNWTVNGKLVENPVLVKRRSEESAIFLSKDEPIEKKNLPVCSSCLRPL